MFSLGRHKRNPVPPSYYPSNFDNVTKNMVSLLRLIFFTSTLYHFKIKSQLDMDFDITSKKLFHSVMKFLLYQFIYKK